jgi:Cytochrome C oxidase, cbb3-type, subunit III
MADKSKKCGPAIVMLVIIVPVLVAMVIWFGWYNVAADVPHSPLTEKILETVRERSMIVRERSIVVPNDLDRPERISAGAGLYDEMCTGCHLAPSMATTELHEGLYPKPPVFASEGDDDPAMAFWVIKHGVKMTAMPAWGLSHTDRQIWDMVAFVIKLKGMSAAGYKTLVASAPPDEDEQHGHEHSY